MAAQYTKEQLDTLDKEVIIQLFLLQQNQLEEIDRKLQTVLEQVAVLNRRSFGKSSEKSEVDNQIAFMEVDGTIVFFNEAEAVASQE